MQLFKGNKNTCCSNQYYNTCCYIAPCPLSQKHKKSINYKFHILCYATRLFHVWIFWPRFLDAKLWHQTGHILASDALFLCTQSMFPRITFGPKWASKRVISMYYIQTRVPVENIRLSYNSTWIKCFWQKIIHKFHGGISEQRLPSSSACFQSNCIDCSPRNIIHTRTHTLQTVCI